ncbi:MAG: YgiT-type zinc finger protein [Desulfococcaceae bacterium]
MMIFVPSVWHISPAVNIRHFIPAGNRAEFMNTYDDCYCCGGFVKETAISREVWWKGSLYVFEKVPAGVCQQCGEKVLKPKVAKAIDSVLKEKSRPQKVIQVPVYVYEHSAA